MCAIELGFALRWKQLFTDGTTQRQIAFATLAILAEGSTNPLIVSSCISLVDETSENIVKAIISKVDELKGRLKLLRQIIEIDCPDVLHLVPHEYSLDVKEKLGDKGAINTYLSCSEESTACSERKNWWKDVRIILYESYEMYLDRS